jgi:hypothetical protein
MDVDSECPNDACAAIVAIGNTVDFWKMLDGSLAMQSVDVLFDLAGGVWRAKLRCRPARRNTAELRTIRLSVPHAVPITRDDLRECYKLCVARLPDDYVGNNVNETLNFGSSARKTIFTLKLFVSPPEWSTDAKKFTMAQLREHYKIEKPK